MEKTVSVKTDSDAVKVAVITQQNKIQTASQKPAEPVQANSVKKEPEHPAPAKKAEE